MPTKSILSAITAIPLLWVTPVVADPVDGTVSLGTGSFATLVGVPATPMSQAEERSVLGASTQLTTPGGNVVYLIPDLVTSIHFAIECVDMGFCSIPRDTQAGQLTVTFEVVSLINIDL